MGCAPVHLANSGHDTAIDHACQCPRYATLRRPALTPALARSVSATARLYAPKGSDEQTPHDLDEFGIVAAGIGHYRVGETVTAFGPGDLLFTAAMSTIDSRIFLPISPSGSNSTGRRSTLGGGRNSNSDTLYFTAGPNSEMNGLFGTITPKN